MSPGKIAPILIVLLIAFVASLGQYDKARERLEKKPFKKK